ncbi:hypothetical protein HN011_003202, partial [Eciton burchellii]
DIEEVHIFLAKRWSPDILAAIFSRRTESEITDVHYASSFTSGSSWLLTSMLGKLRDALFTWLLDHTVDTGRDNRTEDRRKMTIICLVVAEFVGQPFLELLRA